MFQQYAGSIVNFYVSLYTTKDGYLDSYFMNGAGEDSFTGEYTIDSEGNVDIKGGFRLVKFDTTLSE